MCTCSMTRVCGCVCLCVCVYAYVFVFVSKTKGEKEREKFCSLNQRWPSLCHYRTFKVISLFEGILTVVINPSKQL